jgi:hypothetical protein
MLFRSKLSIFAMSALALTTASGAFAAPMTDGSIGLGVMVGEPTGFSGAYTLSPSNTVDGAFAYSFARQGDWQIHSDYLFTNNRWFQDQPTEVAPYFGGGLRLKFESSTRFGIRVPVGVNYQYDSQPIQFFGEIVPIVDLAPGLNLSLDASIGVRYFF